MKQVMMLCAAAALGLAAAVLPSRPSNAASEVLESSVPSLAVGATIEDNARVVVPDGASLRVLIVSTGSTKTLTGPYEGTVEAYKDDRGWWERITGREKDSDAPIGATRGLVRE